ncbi:PREDICTED: putative inactive histone-lysine N-methyltransferase family member SUVH10 [Camelina sativa]|uniref:Inactive histone-lysine N-methyltransferase family member SUVH10 n=1 Tax=Camelina sativa TaxID=90675 RepID=A0ABM0WBB6_CAMSA|nr:PREDICTED: putative inactive histone-lysine N-methyltransferase family member SUVH10 [Camelina sativa]
MFELLKYTLSLIFTGFGGTTKFHDHQPSDQKLEGLNIPLEAALRKLSAVRVIRGVKDEKRTNGKIYIYDGIYFITSMWEEKGQNGFKVFKFKLVRQPDQKPAFGIWKSVQQQWKNGLTTRPGLILEDLSNGAENLKVSVVNEVDEEKNGPALFTYVTSLKHAVINIQPVVDRCTCRQGSCGASRSGSCACVQRNVGGLPYVENALETRGPMVFECGGSCACSKKCKNKMIQTGLNFSFEVFKTRYCGWGLRSWDPIRAGSFICEFAGDMIIAKGGEEEDDYVFDTSRVYNSFKWNYEPELVGEDASNKVSEAIRVNLSLVISANKSGNVARFMNHSCSPNVFWQPIAREQNGLWCMYIGFFAMKHIPPLTELRYDYGASPGVGQKKRCLCRSKKCCGLFG